MDTNESIWTLKARNLWWPIRLSAVRPCPDVQQSSIQVTSSSRFGPCPSRSTYWSLTFDDNSFSITSAIPMEAAIPMYNDERTTDAKTRSKQALAVGEGSDDLIWCTPKQTMQKKNRAGIVFRAARGGRADWRPPIEDTNLIFTSCSREAKLIWNTPRMTTPLQKEMLLCV